MTKRISCSNGPAEQPTVAVDLETSGHPLIRGLKRRPLLLPALALMAGVWVGGRLSPALSLWLAGLALLAVMVRLNGSVILALWFWIGLFLPGPLPEKEPVVSRIIARGSVIAAVEEQLPRWQRTDITLRILASTREGDEVGKLALWRRHRDLGLDSTFTVGDTVAISGQLVYPAGERNPGAFSQRQHLWTRGIDYLFYAESDTILAKSAGGNSGSGIGRVRSGMIAAMNQWWGPHLGGLARGLLLGDKAGLDPKRLESLRSLGAGHLLAVSGLHVGYVVLVVVAVFTLFRVRGSVQAGLIAPLLLFYILLTGGPPSVIRASVLAFLYMLGRALQRLPDRWNLLAATLMISLVINPRSLWAPGFQLSFAAVTGIFYLYPVTKSVLISRGWYPARRMWKWPIDLAMVSLCAQLGLMPVSLYHFHTLPLAGILSNIILIPLTGFVVAGEIAAFLLAWLPPFMHQTITDGAGLLLWILDRLAALGGDRFGLMWITGQPAPAVLALMVATLAGLPYLLEIHSVLGRRWLMGLLLLANLVVWPGVLKRPVVEVTFLDIGQGDAAHVALPNGSHLLIDTGPNWHFGDAGRLHIIPYLRARGISVVSDVLISHPHADHIGGLPSLIEAGMVRAVWQSHHSGRSRLVHTVEHLAEEGGLPMVSLQPGDILEWDQVSVSVLAPDSLSGIGSRNLNNASLVLRLDYGRTSLLFPGDIEGPLERRLLIYDGTLDVDWLKVCHHGSATSTTPDFLQKISPDGAVISAGRDNRYGHPGTTVIERLKQNGIYVHRTDTQGALRIRSDGREWKLVQGW